MSIDIDPLPDAAGLTVTDHIENTQFELYTDRPVEPAAAPETAHYFPVDASVTVETGGIEIPRVAVVEARSGDGTLLTRGDDYALPAGEYHVGIDPAPTKLYLSFSSPFAVSTTDRTTRIDLDAPAEVTLGFRSLHQVPAGTIETPTDPESLMDAVSLLGSALQTTSPERSFPTLRGHPPLIEPGERLRVPDRVEPTDSGVRIVVPPEYRYLYPVVSLAYYFAAEVVPGDPPRIEGDGWTHALEPDFERRAAEALRQAFHFDCLARTEGFYPVDLHERETTALDLDWGRLYDLPLATRLGEYLAVPFERVEPELPQWTLTTDVRPEPENVELLPFVAGELSIVRAPETVTPATAGADNGLGFFRGPGTEAAPLGPNEFVRGATEAPPAAPTRGADASGERGAVAADTEFVQRSRSTRSSTRGSVPASRSTPTRPRSTRTTAGWRRARSSSRASPSSSSATTSRCARRGKWPTSTASATWSSSTSTCATTSPARRCARRSPPTSTSFTTSGTSTTAGCSVPTSTST